MAVNGVTTTNNVTSTNNTPTTSSASSSNLGIDRQSFLKLLVAQMQNQDPMNPMDNQQFVAELAQLQTVEQLQEVADSLQTSLAMSSVDESLALLGRHIEYQDADGLTKSGLVDKVKVSGGVPMLEVDGQEVAPGSVTAVTSA